jgi:integrase
LRRLTASKLRDVGPRDLNRILDSLSPTSRTQAIRTYTAFFNWCIRRHYLDTSPCARMVAGQSTSRARVLSDQELQSIWRACEVGARPPLGSQTDDLPSLPQHFVTVVKLLILTGQRRGEISALRREYFSHNQQTICLPGELTKNGREHTFPVGHTCCLLLNTHSHQHSDFLFPARGKTSKPFNGWSKSKKALDKLSGVTGWTLHDLRRTFRTNLGKLGVAPYIAERLVNHVSAQTDMERVYDQYKYMPEMRDAFERNGRHIPARRWFSFT